MHHPLRLVLAAICALACAAHLQAQTAPLAQKGFVRFVDSGPVSPTGGDRDVTWRTVVTVGEAPWTRLRFGLVDLSRSAELRITSLATGAVHRLDRTSAEQWNWTSAYMVGAVLLVELVDDPGAAASRVRIDGGWRGVDDEGEGDPTESICGSTDDRQLSNDPRCARVMPVGCSVWLIEDPGRNFLSAGHCNGGGFEVVQFNVPLSTSGGGYLPPGPEDQYPVDASSRQQQSGGIFIGNDWVYFGCFPNSNTGLTAFQAQGDAFALRFDPPQVTGDIRITGYGTVSSPVPLTWNGVQKTHAGPFTSIDGNALRYRADTTGGNSGSPVIHEVTGEAIGVHTNGGCGSGGGANSGCALWNAGLMAALLDPQGVCVPASVLRFEYPGGRPTAFAPDGSQLFEVDVLELGGATLDRDSVELVIALPQGDLLVPLASMGGDRYGALIPEGECGDDVSWYVGARTTDGDVRTDPAFVAIDTWTAVRSYPGPIAFDDDGESDGGWEVVNVELTGGAWERGVPAGDGTREDPTTDFDGSGACWLTENGPGDTDVDGGPTMLVSAPIDLTGLDNPWLAYGWWVSQAGDATNTLDVAVSTDDGATWTLVASHLDQGAGWEEARLPIADAVGGADSVRLRFSIADNPNASITEAAVDAMRIEERLCTPPATADLDGDGVVGFEDLLLLLADWGACPAPPADCPADLDGDGLVGFEDVLALLAAWS